MGEIRIRENRAQPSDQALLIKGSLDRVIPIWSKGSILGWRRRSFLAE
jgi:hypothetical protein